MLALLNILVGVREGADLLFMQKHQQQPCKPSDVCFHLLCTLLSPNLLICASCKMLRAAVRGERSRVEASCCSDGNIQNAEVVGSRMQTAPNDSTLSVSGNIVRRSCTCPRAAGRVFS